MKQKKPYHCEGCKHHHKAGHKQGTPLHGSKFDNWCCKYSTAAPRAVSICKIQGGKSYNAEVTGRPLAAVGWNEGLGACPDSRADVEGLQTWTLPRTNSA